MFTEKTPKSNVNVFFKNIITKKYINNFDCYLKNFLSNNFYYHQGFL